MSFRLPSRVLGLPRAFIRSRRRYTTEPTPSAAQRQQAVRGPFSWPALVLFVSTGGGLLYYFQLEKQKLELKKKQESADQKVGRPKIGGTFNLTNQDGKPFSSQDLLGRFSLVYFGFTNCPDICPEELDKMGQVVDQIAVEQGQGTILPVFVTCDPARDDQKAMKTYLKDFHPTMVGLTGTYEEIKAVCKVYRVYFSTPPNAKPTDDYLVDHSIFFYLMDPEGKFVDAFGRSFSKDEVTAKRRALPVTTMKYRSTRGDSDTYNFQEAVLQGLGKDGGLFLPSQIPSLPSNWQEQWSNLSFQEICLQVLSLFISREEISESELKGLIKSSFSTFRHPDITPIHYLDRLCVLELWHGPTFAFKDVALQFLGNLFEFLLLRKNGNSKQRQKLTVVGATSGDTGSAAIYGLRGKKDVDIFILHPKGRVSPIQEAQMTTVLDSNVHNLAVQGTFDDCQDIVKTLFGDRDFNKQYSLGAINSINWARILTQIVYYFHSYFQLLRKHGQTAAQFSQSGKKIQFVVPTGNFGDILAGWYAKQLGLPMDKLVIATNENDILTRFLHSGIYEKAASSKANLDEQTEKVNGATDGGQSGVKATLAPAMDILVSSNFERLLFHYVLRDANGDYNQAGRVLKDWMADLKATGKVEVGSQIHQAACRDFEAFRVDDKEILKTIQRYHKEQQYIVDPHTAIGLAAADQLPALDSTIKVVLATAHPAKFSSAVEEALDQDAGFSFDQILPQEFKGLLEKERRVIDVPGIDPELTKKVIIDSLTKITRGEDGALDGVSV